MIRLYKIGGSSYAEQNGHFYHINEAWDHLINQKHLYQYVLNTIPSSTPVSQDAWNQLSTSIEAPIGSQEVWASGVTYLRSRDARMEESEHAKSAYDLVYDADRPELFFKSLAHRVAGPGTHVFIRKDSTWNVPEPEFTLFINRHGEIAACTIGNDMSSRSIEGENTLYLPQAKTYERSAALGPCLLILDGAPNLDTNIDLKIFRNDKCVFHGQTKLNTMKRTFPELRDYLLRGLKFDQGCFLMTGTGIVPPSVFTLESEDLVRIEIDEIGVLENGVKWL